MEKKQRPPTARVLIASFILFGTPSVDLFPGLFSHVEKDVMARVWDMYERIQGEPSKRTKAKIELLEDAIERAKTPPTRTASMISRRTPQPRSVCVSAQMRLRLHGV